MLLWCYCYGLVHGSPLTQALVRGVADLLAMLGVRGRQTGDMVGAEDVKQLLSEGRITIMVCSKTAHDNDSIS